MSVIFQLFSAEDLLKFTPEQLEELKNRIMTALKESTGQSTLGEPPVLSLKLAPKTAPDPKIAPQINDALHKRFQDVSHQLKSPQLDSAPQIFDFDNLIKQRNDNATRKKEDVILEWAITCEVNNYEFYNALLQAKEVAYAYFKEVTTSEKDPDGLRPKGPDTQYSPFNPRHPLFDVLYGFSNPESNPSQGTPYSSS
jgi:hypothetical protein